MTDYKDALKETAVKVGNYTKHAVKNFEQNIVDQTNYLEKVEEGLKSKLEDDIKDKNSHSGLH